MNQTWENVKKPNFGPILALLPQILTQKLFLSFACTGWDRSKLSSYAIKRKTNETNLTKEQNQT